MGEVSEWELALGTDHDNRYPLVSILIAYMSL